MENVYCRIICLTIAKFIQTKSEKVRTSLYFPKCQHLVVQIIECPVLLHVIQKIIRILQILQQDKACADHAIYTVPV